MRTVAILLLTATVAFAAEPPSTGQISARFERAEAAIESGSVDPARDLAPLIALLRSVKDPGDLGRVASRIGDLGEADGDAPVAVKRYLVEQATPILVEMAANTKYSGFVRGDAIHALRDLMPPREVLQQVADMALKDKDGFVQSRGEILANYVKSLPEEPESSAIKPTDAAKEREAIAFLREHDLGVSLDQLRLSSIGAKHEEVAALLAAGVDPNAGPAADSPLNRALSACAHEGGENDEIAKTVQLLLTGGTDLEKLDDNKNTALMSAAQYCDGTIVRMLLDAGARPNVVNGSGITPLGMALLMGHLDGAEALVAKGARLTPEQAEMVSGMATSDRAKAIVKKATKK